MKLTRFTWLSAILVLTAALVAGCGGGGSGSTGGGGGGGGGSQLFAVDDMNAGFDHVWVTIDSVALTTSGGGTTTIFDATAQGGRVVDLRSLHDGAGARFLLLGGFNVPPGSYTGITVTTAAGLTVFPTGATTGTAATFAGATGNKFVMTLALMTSQTSSQSSRVIVDFNLANWTLTGTTVSAANNAFLTLGSPNGINDGSRHVASDYDGTLSSLGGTAPAQTFTLTQGSSSLNVATNSSTVINNSDGSANPALANGQLLDVFGTFDTTTNVLTATAITIRIGGSRPPERVRGVVTAFDATAGTITLQPGDCDWFEPTSSALTIDVNSNTMFFGNSGVTDTQAQFFAALVAGNSKVAVDGSLSGSTMTAVAIRIYGPPPIPTTIDTAVQGMVSNANVTAGTFDLSIHDWEGGRVDRDATVHIVTTSSTVVRVNGQASTLAAFFTALGSNSFARVRGSLDLSTMTLTAVVIGTSTDNDDFHF
ncbi:MAG TPA: DUF4382 domain-containing protein [Fimbriimonadaceae bacterium]|nr:DUF4382 domain-containing protein [Fimbriimonadaceae bacterium]